VTIPFIDLKTQYQNLKAEIDGRINAVLEHGKFIMGPEVVELENALCDFSGAKHAICVANGTDALQIALMAKGVGPGDAVFVPTFTFTATAEVVLLLGATPVFVDVLKDTFNIDPDDLKQKIATVKNAGDKTPKAIIAVDLFGQPANYDAVNALAAANGMFVLADSAQSFGASLGDTKVGTLAEMTSTSFFPAKPLGCFGDGGAVFTDNDELADRMRSIRLHGKGGAKYDIARVGVNSRLDTIQAAVLLAKLPVFSGELAARDLAAKRYDAKLPDKVVKPALIAGATSAWAQYTIQVENRSAVQAALQEHGVPTAVYYPMPMHLQQAYKPYGGGEGALPVSEELSSTVLSLPMHPYLDEETQDKICDAVAMAL